MSDDMADEERRVTRGIVLRFPKKLCAMCGERATQSIDLVDEYGRSLGQKHLCDEYPHCTGPLSERDKPTLLGRETVREALEQIKRISGDHVRIDWCLQIHEIADRALQPSKE